MLETPRDCRPHDRAVTAVPKLRDISAVSVMAICIYVQHYGHIIRLKVEVRMKDEKIPLYGVYLDVDGDRLRTAGV